MKKLLLVLLTIVFLTGCQSLFDKEVLECSVGFHVEGDICVEDVKEAGTFSNQSDIFSLVESFQEKQSLVSRSWGWNFFMVEDAAMDAEGGDAPTNQDKGSDDYSETNNQVEGVDEMDNVLTDGKYIYVSNYNKIQIILAYTTVDEYEVLDLVKEIDLEGMLGENTYFYFNGMYVDDDRLIVVGNSYHHSCMQYEESKEVDPNKEETGETGDATDDAYQYCRYYEYHQTTHVFEYSKDDFELINEYELSGYYVGSRKIGDSIYFVTNEWIPFYYQQYEDYDFNLDNYLPSYQINETEVALNYEDIIYVEGTEPATFTSFFGINLETNEVSTEVVLGEGGYNLYVSVDNIYLTNTKWVWDWAVMDVLEENARDNDTSNDEEVDEDPFEITTSIIRIGIEQGVVSYSGNGEVPGMALDQFAMDERDGYVRIVTTSNNWWWWGTDQEINNRLMILDQNLDIVSTLEGLGKEGETVQSTRFVGDYAYVVTFLRTDPFYVIDVSDPLNPVKLSELEIPGFSDYLQPIGEDYILGIGFGDNEGGTQGLKISLYDVSDKSNAVVASEIIYPYADYSYIWTSTVYNHKDLLVSQSKGIIALPYTQNTWTEDYRNWSYETGVLVLNLDVENGEISERARVEHSEENQYGTYVFKSKFISDYLYTISSKYVMVSTIDDPATVLKSVQIGESYPMDVPHEVEPGEDPDCSDADCTTTETQGIYEDFNHIEDWDKFLTQAEDEYYVYAYSMDSEIAREIEEQIFEFAHNSDIVLYFIDVDHAAGELGIDAIPSLVKISNGEMVEELTGIDEILEFIVQ